MSLEELVGYVASGLIALSITQSSLWRLRWLNLAGGVSMGVYGVLIAAWPVLVVNCFTASVNAWHLVRLASGPTQFRLLEIHLEPPSAYVRTFLAFYAEDIARFQPGFDFDRVERPRGFLILRDMVPAGIVIYEPRDDRTVELHLDYVAPPYRDLKNARYAYHKRDEDLRQQGYEAWVADADVAPKHLRYLKRIGFRPDPARSGWLRRPL